MKTTIITPVYNRAKFIEQALLSIIRQRDKNELHILVVDDGSTDSSASMVKNMAEEYGGIDLIQTENLGVASARNTGLKNVPKDSKFISFLDSDDISPENRFADDLKSLKRDSSLVFTYGKMLLTDEIGEDSLPAPDAKQVIVRGISLSAGIYRKEFIDEVGLFDEGQEQAEDTDYLLRVFERGVPHALTETICVYYRRHAGNMTKNQSVALRAFMRAIQKSIHRRRANPTIKVPVDIFDLKALMETRLD